MPKCYCFFTSFPHFKFCLLLANRKELISVCWPYPVTLINCLITSCHLQVMASLLFPSGLKVEVLKIFSFSWAVALAVPQVQSEEKLPQWAAMEGLSVSDCHVLSYGFLQMLCRVCVLGSLRIFFKTPIWLSWLLSCNSVSVSPVPLYCC